MTTSRDGRQKATRRRVVRSAAGAGGAAALVLAGQEADEAGTTRASAVLQALLDQSPG